MDSLAPLIRFLTPEMERPDMYGWFHLLFFALSIIAAILLCRHVKPSEKNVRIVLLVTAITVIVMEIYKHFVYSFEINDAGKVVFDYPWYIFPWQFCSTPMFFGLFAGLTKGKVHRALCAYLSTYALFAGASVMFYPSTVFISLVGINIQTMVCHGSMITVGVYLLYTQYVENKHKTMLRALPVFIGAVAVAAILNEIAYRVGLLETDNFNMFFISPYQDPHLPVYSLVQQYVPFPWCLGLYILGFTAAGYILLLIAMGIRELLTKKNA